MKNHIKVGVRIVSLLLVLVATVTFATAYEGSTFRLTTAGSGYFGNYQSVSYYDAGHGSYGMTRLPNGDVYGGYSAISNGRVNSAGFGYSNNYGVTYANANNPSVRGSVYRTPYGGYGGSVGAGYPTYARQYGYSNYGSYAVRVPNYYGSSI